ncbi:Uncharacterised protein [Achromobacter sp. 2789STDY5608633]|nr:Uncharacterised protein [Achromobacter sp. 2789STDY5608633]
MRRDLARRLRGVARIDQAGIGRIQPLALDDVGNAAQVGKDAVEMRARHPEPLHQPLRAEIGLRQLMVDIVQHAHAQCLAQHRGRRMLDRRRGDQARGKQRAQRLQRRGVFARGELARDRVEAAKVILEQARHGIARLQHQSVKVARAQRLVDTGPGNRHRQALPGVHLAVVGARQVDEADASRARHHIAAVEIPMYGARDHDMHQIMVQPAAGDRRPVALVALRIEGRGAQRQPTQVADAHGALERGPLVAGDHGRVAERARHLAPVIITKRGGNAIGGNERFQAGHGDVLLQIGRVEA